MRVRCHQLFILSSQEALVIPLLSCVLIVGRLLKKTSPYKWIPIDKVGTFYKRLPQAQVVDADYGPIEAVSRIPRRNHPIEFSLITSPICSAAGKILSEILDFKGRSQSQYILGILNHVIPVMIPFR